MPRVDPLNRARYWWDAHIPGLSLLHADFTTHEYPPHTHEALVVAVTEQGGSVVRSRGTTELAEPDALFVFNPVEAHAGWMGASARWRYRSLYLERAAIDSVAGDLGVGDALYFTRNRIDDPQLAASFRRLHAVLEQDGDSFVAQELMTESFGTLFQRYASSGPRFAASAGDRCTLARVMERMRTGYAERLGLAELAREAGLTTFQLIGLFRRCVGITPHAWLTQVRLNVACRHLRRGRPIAEAALAAGFADQSAMSRHFKRCYGMTPRQLVRAAASRRLAA